MPPFLLKAYQLVKNAGLEFSRDKCPRLGAALAFYTALSIAPLLVVVIAIAGFVFGDDAARGEVAGQIKNLVGEDGAQAVQTMLANQTKSTGVVATVLGVATLVFGATGVFAQLQDAIDTVWGVKPDETPSGILAMVKDRILSFSLVCGLAFLLLVSLVFSAVLNAVTGWVNSWFPGAAAWLGVGNVLLTLALTTVLFALIFKVLPHAKPKWSDVWVGAGLTALLFGVGKFLIGLYLGTAAVGSAYGAAGSFVVLLVWIYYSTQILLFGAEFTQVYAAKHGSGIKVLGAEKKERAAEGDHPTTAPVPAGA